VIINRSLVNDQAGGGRSSGRGTGCGRNTDYRPRRPFWRSRPIYDPVDDPSLNNGVHHPEICSDVKLSMSIACFLISCHNRSKLNSVLSELNSKGSGLLCSSNRRSPSTGFTRFCYAAVQSSVTPASMRPSSSYSRATTVNFVFGAPVPQERQTQR
jgi:hypothetical protein